MVSISVITPTFERGAFIEAAVESAAGQSVRAFEHIIIDGASKDDTIARLARYPHLQIISEPDKGLYDALNKGVGRAKGDVICLLNSDDRVLPAAFEVVSRVFESSASIECVCGRARVGDASGLGRDVELGGNAMQRLRAEDVISGMTLTNARFFRRDFLLEVGLFDQNFPILADRDFLGRCYLRGMRTAVVDRALYRYGTHDRSLSFGTTAGSLAYNIEALRLAETRFAQSNSSAERAFYRRWLGWAIGYALLRGGTSGEFAAAWQASGSARRLFPSWPLAFAVHAAWHHLSRAERRGRRV